MAQCDPPTTPRLQSLVGGSRYDPALCAGMARPPSTQTSCGCGSAPADEGRSGRPTSTCPPILGSWPNGGSSATSPATGSSPRRTPLEGPARHAARPAGASSPSVCRSALATTTTRSSCTSRPPRDRPCNTRSRRRRERPVVRLEQVTLVEQGRGHRRCSARSRRPAGTPVDPSTPRTAARLPMWRALAHRPPRPDRHRPNQEAGVMIPGPLERAVEREVVDLLVDLFEYANPDCRTCAGTGVLDEATPCPRCIVAVWS